MNFKETDLLNHLGKDINELLHELVVVGGELCDDGLTGRTRAPSYIITARRLTVFINCMQFQYQHIITTIDRKLGGPIDNIHTMAQCDKADLLIAKTRFQKIADNYLGHS